MIFLFCEWFVIFEFYNNTEDGGMVMKEIMIETKALKKYYQMANNVVKALDGVSINSSSIRLPSNCKGKTTFS